MSRAFASAVSPESWLRASTSYLLPRYWYTWYLVTSQLALSLSAFEDLMKFLGMTKVGLGMQNGWASVSRPTQNINRFLFVTSVAHSTFSTDQVSFATRYYYVIVVASWRLSLAEPRKASFCFSHNNFNSAVFVAFLLPPLTSFRQHRFSS